MTYRFGRGARSAHLLRRPSGVVASSGAVLPTTDLLVRLEASASSITTDGGSPPEVTAWADQDAQSGPHDVTQATATTRPEYQATGGPEGGPAIAFGAQSTDGDGFLRWTSAIDASATPVTAYFVLDPKATGTRQEILDIVSGRLNFQLDDGAGNMRIRVGATTTAAIGAATTGWQCLTFQVNGGAGRIFRARSQVGSDGVVGANVALGGAQMHLGSSVTAGSFTLNALMASMHLYGAEHDATEREQVWDHLATLYPSVGL